MEKLEGKVILIVDDEPRNTFALSNYLESWGMKIVIAENGEEAISGLRKNINPDVILLDMMMPVMDGYETLGELKKDDLLQKIPVIAVTAKAMKGDEEKCMEAGAWDYISKPVDLDLLISKITKWII